LYNKQRRNYNGKSKVFDHGELEETVPGDCYHDRYRKL